jgi:RNA polymerase sigma factor (sigma-70 family)
MQPSSVSVIVPNWRTFMIVKSFSDAAAAAPGSSATSIPSAAREAALDSAAAGQSILGPVGCGTPNRQGSLSVHDLPSAPRLTIAPFALQPRPGRFSSTTTAAQRHAERPPVRLQERPVSYKVRPIARGIAGMDAQASRNQLAAALMRVGEGDGAALRMVYRDTSAKLFGVCLRILNDKSEAEDMLQDVYVTVWRKAASFDPGRASPITWLVAIARNRAIDRLRSSAVTRRTEPIEAADAVSDLAPAAVERVELAQQHQRLARCLEELEGQHSAAIRAAFLDGSTYGELAQQMSVPLGTMKSWIRRGLLKLRACLEG